MEGHVTHPLTESQVLTLIRESVTACGSQKQAASCMGISPQYLNDIVQGKRDISEKVAAYFGLKRVVTFVHKEDK